MAAIIKSKHVLVKLLVFVFVSALLFLEFSTTANSPPGRKAIDEAAALMSSRILLTRQKAKASNTCYRICCDYREGICRIYRQGSDGHWVPDGPDDLCAFPNGVSVSPTSRPSDGTIEIDQHGVVVSRDGPVVLKLTDQHGTLRSVRIFPSGTVQESANW